MNSIRTLWLIFGIGLFSGAAWAQERTAEERTWALEHYRHEVGEEVGRHNSALRGVDTFMDKITTRFANAVYGIRDARAREPAQREFREDMRLAVNLLNFENQVHQRRMRKIRERFSDWNP